MARLTPRERMDRLARVKDAIREPKARLMSALQELEDVDASLARRLGTVIGKIEDIQRRLPG